MAIPGRKPKPPELRIIEGNREHRPIRQTVKPAKEIPGCPQWLNPVGKTEWKRISKELEKLNLLVKIDMAALALYCQNYAVVVQCSNYINSKGGFAKYLKDRNAQTSPHITVMNKAMTQIHKICTEFGMTPSARGRMIIGAEEEDGEEDLD